MRDFTAAYSVAHISALKFEQADSDPGDWRQSTSPGQTRVEVSRVALLDALLAGLGLQDLYGTSYMFNPAIYAPPICRRTDT